MPALHAAWGWNAQEGFGGKDGLKERHIFGMWGQGRCMVRCMSWMSPGCCLLSPNMHEHHSVS